jgi:AraC family transcriptional regulator
VTSNPSDAAPKALQAPRFERTAPKRIAGLRQHFTSSSLDDIPALWQRLVSQGQVPERKSPVDYAVVTLLPTGCDYLAGFEIGASAALPGDFVCLDIPANEYAIFAHDGHVSTIRNTFDAVLSRWLPTSQLQIADGPGGVPYALERYGEKFDPVAGRGDIELWLPVWGKS